MVKERETKQETSEWLASLSLEQKEAISAQRRLAWGEIRRVRWKKSREREGRGKEEDADSSRRIKRPRTTEAQAKQIGVTHRLVDENDASMEEDGTPEPEPEEKQMLSTT